MATAIETALAALASALDAATSAPVIRNSDRAEDVPAAGLVVLRDGEQVDAEETFSPLRYHVNHQAEVIVIAPDETDRDALLEALSDALVANRTLSGAVEWLEVLPVSLDLGDYEGAEAARGARMPVLLHYTTLGGPVG
jgi:hypothetical protein